MATALSILAFAGIQPVLVLKLSQAGVGAFEIGVLASSVYTAIVLMGPAVTWMSWRWGEKATYLIGRSILSLSYVSFLLSVGFWSWLPGFVLLGVGAALVWPTTEVFIARNAPANKKGRITGLYQAGLGFAFSLGPFLSLLLVDEFSTLVALCFAISLLSVAPVVTMKWLQPVQGAKRFGLLSGWKLLSVSLLSLAFIGGAFENGLNALSVEQALELGFSSQFSMSTAGWIGLGSFVAQYPLGLLADRRGVGKVMTLSFLCLLFSVAMIPLSSQVGILFVVACLIWGAFGGALYTLAMTDLAQRFSGSELMPATSAMVMLYTLGGSLGPFLGGAGLEFSRFFGLASVFAVFSVWGLLVSVTRRSSMGT